MPQREIDPTTAAQILRVKISYLPDRGGLDQIERRDSRLSEREREREREEVFVNGTVKRGEKN